MCNVVNNVGIVQPSSLVLPPALDVNTRLSLKVGQVEVVSEDTKHKKRTSTPLSITDWYV